MLYLHCGLPKTSTTSLQVTLCENQSRLSAAGILYPDRWRVEAGPGAPRSAASHRGLHDLLQALERSEGALDDFRDFLERHSDAHILLSSEYLSLWLQPEHKQEVLLAFLTAAQEAMPTKCVWTLRRLDEVLESLYRPRLALGYRLRPPGEYVSSKDGPIPQFVGIQRVEEVLNGNVAYVRYDSTGAHNRELLHAFRIPDPLQTEIFDDLERGPRRNTGWSHKQVVALLNVEQLSNRSGVDLDRKALRTAFSQDGFVFEDDGPCVLLESGLRQSMLTNALTRAKAQGFSPYVEFFHDAQIEELPPVSLEPELITSHDLRRLVGHLR